MKSGRPSISTRPKKPVKPKRANPKIHKPSSPIGQCLLCGEAFSGPAAIRLQHGCVRRRKWGVQFIELPFDDREKKKWVCYGCSLDNYILMDDGFQFSSHLKELSKNGWCCLCHKVIEPYPLEEWSSAILIERGMMEPRSNGPGSLFRVKEAGHLHYFCLDDINIELWRIIERTDVPDYYEWLSSCA